MAADPAPPAPGPYLQTVSGRFFNPFEPDLEQLDPGDIACALANLCRFGGHCRPFYSVAQHSVIVSRLVEERGGDAEDVFAALMHDAAEAYLGNWTNDYHGVARVEQAAAGLQMRLGPNGQTVYALRHWSGDTFTFVPLNDSATPGSVSRADFTPGGLVLEHYNHNGLGVFSRG